MASCTLREVKSVRDTIRFYEDEILNYFDGRKTNASAESLNSKIKCFRAQSQEDVDYIMECVRLAPSAVNRQPWHWLIVRSDEAKEKLQECYDREWFKTAPMYSALRIVNPRLLCPQLWQLRTLLFVHFIP